jgi:hypothetical protein
VDEQGPRQCARSSKPFRRGKLAEIEEFNNGEPERCGDERNYQRYLDRVEEMKAAIARTQSDLAALKRELAKLPAAKE